MATQNNCRAGEAFTIILDNAVWAAIFLVFAMLNFNFLKPDSFF